MAFSLILSVFPFRFASAGSVQTLPPVTDADGRLGMCDVLPGSAPGTNGLPWAQLAFDAGARVDRWEIRWDRVEPAAGVWTYAANDAAVQSSMGAGLQVEGILIGTPAWATGPGQKPGNGLPRGLNLLYTDPRNLWADYVRQTVTHYAGRIHDWEIWNEPDLQYFWTGSPDAYYRLLKVASRVIHDVDSGANVIMAGMVVPDLAFLGQVLDAANRDSTGASNHGYFNAAAWHAYGPARSLFTDILKFKALLVRGGFPNTPIWVTEDGFPANNPNGEPRQAAYVEQTIAYAFAAGAAKLLVYRASDSAEPKTWGLLSASGSPRMGYVAFQVAAHYLSGLQALTYEPLPNVERLVFYEPDVRVTMLWNHGLADQMVSVLAGRQTATLVDWMGHATPVTAVDGQFQVVVPAAVYNAGVDPAGSVVGGPPVLLIEDNTPPGQPGSQVYIAPVTGSIRRLVIFNQGAAQASAQVNAADNPKYRIMVQLAPRDVRSVDLDLLAGSSYQGLYVLSSPDPVTGEAVSDQATVPGTAASSSWYMAAAPAQIALANPKMKPIVADVTAFGPKGVVRLHSRVRLQPRDRQDLVLPVGPGSRLISLAIKATGPVVLLPTGSASADPVPQPQSTWYAVRPSAAPLSIFNPDSKAPVRIDVRFVGSAVTSEELRISPHHAFVLRSGNAKAIVLAASQGVSVAYTQSPAPATSLTSQPVTQTAIEAAGDTTRIALFNPAQKPAHVSLSILGGANPLQVSKVLAPSQVSTMRVRTQSGPPLGVMMNSDVPVVATPAS